MKKYLAEMVGTFVLVLMGCGTAVVMPCNVNMPETVLATAIAFGLAVVAMAYTIGNISGCHINPAITLGVWMSGRMSGKDAGMYMVFQTIGAIIAAAVLAFLGPKVACDGVGANTCAFGITWVGLVAEIILTFIFVLVVLGTTDAKKGAGKLAGLAIGLTLILIHLVGIRFTGTSVNPARSIGPAIFAGGQALKEIWVFIIGPFAGAALAALTWKCLGKAE